ncbi:MAG: MBL fold metallo-hydrolase [Phycisphaerales bacterium]|nr:MAG: MBL fold metallo-hydrolase [Phycisphaerales bacterium]
MKTRQPTMALATVACLCVRAAWGGDIHDAVLSRDGQRVGALLADDPRLVDCTDNKGRTPLHLAAFRGDRDIVELLIARGAKRGSRDRTGRMPSDAAGVRGHDHLLDILVENQTVKVSDHLYQITLSYGLRPNTVVSIGSDGVLAVDTGHDRVARELARAVHAVGKGRPTHVINTHMHHDHVGGNAVLAEGATLINHSTLEQCVAEGVIRKGERPLRGKSGRVFDTWYSMRFNGEEVRLIHSPGAHSGGDLIVHFTSSGVVHMGDLLLSQSFPSVGEHVPEYREILDTVIDVFPPDTVFVSGHGRFSQLQDLHDYRAMLLKTIGAVNQQIKAGKSVEQMQQEDVLGEWESWGDFLRFLNTDNWIRAIYDSYANETASIPPPGA